LISKADVQHLQASCESAFAFLRQHGFGSAQLSEDAAAHSTTFRFYGSAIAIECIWDDREEVLEVKVARLRAGKAPGEFAVDAGGRRVRDHLTQILLRRGVRDLALRKVPKGTPLIDQWTSWLEDYARLLQQHGQDVLQQVPDLFD
jgi:hypothetical protein